MLVHTGLQKLARHCAAATLHSSGVASRRRGSHWQNASIPRSHVHCGGVAAAAAALLSGGRLSPAAAPRYARAIASGHTRAAVRTPPGAMPSCAAPPRRSLPPCCYQDWQARRLPTLATQLERGAMQREGPTADDFVTNGTVDWRLLPRKYHSWLHKHVQFHHTRALILHAYGVVAIFLCCKLQPAHTGCCCHDGCARTRREAKRQ